MGDSRRFKEFGSLILRLFPNRSTRIADIGGGYGHLNSYLKDKGYQSVITIDDRNNRLRNISYKKGWLTDQNPENFDLLVGLHCDEATDVIIREAGKLRLPFIIVPCCIKPTEYSFFGKGFLDWLHHLECKAEQLGFTTQRYYLPIKGKNTVILGKFT